MEELVKRLRAAAIMSDALSVFLPHSEGSAVAKLYNEAADAIEELSRENKEIMFRANQLEAMNDALIGETGATDALMVASKPRWIPVTERLPECDLGSEVGNIEWISCGMVHSGCFGRGGKYRDAYFRAWTDAGEGMDAKDADYWRAVALPAPPKEGET